MAKGDDVRRKRLREPQLRYRTKKPRLHAGKLQLDREFINSLNLQTSPARSTAVPATGRTESRPTDRDRGLTASNLKSLRGSLWNQPLQKPEMNGTAGLSPRLALPEAALDTRYVLNSSPTDVHRGLQSWSPGARRPSVWTIPLRRERPPDYHKEKTASRLVKQIIKQTCDAVGRPDLADWALAIAMQEDKTLSGNYPFGDIFPEDPKRPGRLEEVLQYPELDPTARPGFPKRGGAANFGIYKMNWYMIKQCESAKSRAKSLDIDVNARNAWIPVGQEINNDPGLATQILIEAMSKWSTVKPAYPELKDKEVGNFWAGHRFGSSGLNDEPPPGMSLAEMRKSILNYYDAIWIIRAYIESDRDKAWNTPLRYGEDVPNI